MANSASLYVSQFRRRLGVEALEARLAPANLHITSAVLVDAYNSAEPAPVTGQMIYIRSAWTTSGMAGGEQYVIRYSVDGIALDPSTQTASAGGGSYSLYEGGWYAAPGTHTLTATVDGASGIVETDETDNTISFMVTTVTPTDLPQKFLRPAGYQLNRDWSITNYADVDPRSGIQADYRGGPFQYDGHDAIDAGPWGFSSMDAGFPIVAAADGTVTQVQDGNFDRNTSANNNPANFVRINHGNNWETLYYHLMRDSITVKVGDVVKAGQIIGLMGSSGSSTAQHVHFTPIYRGCEVEMGYDTATYETQPMPYGGDVATFAFEAGVTNYNPTPDISEHASPLTTYGTTQSGTIYAWCEFYNTKNTDALSWKWYRPDGTQAYSFGVTAGAYRDAWYFSARGISSFTSIPGTWQVAESINGVEVQRTNFTIVAGNGVAAVKFTNSAGSILLDERETPVDFGSITQGGTAPTQAFTIVNHGGAALDLSNYVVPPGFSVVGTPPASVAAAGSATVTVQLDTAVVGAKFGAFKVDTNDPLVPAYNFTLSGIVTGTPAAGTPTIDLSTPFALAYDPSDVAEPIAPAATLSAPLSASISTLMVEFAANGRDTDQLGVRNQGNGTGQIGVTGATVSYGGAVIGSFAGGNNLTPLVFTLNSTATVAAVQALMRSVTYVSATANPATAPRFVRFLVLDNAGRLSNLAIKNVSITDLHRVLAIADLPAASVTRGSTLDQTGSFTDPTGFSWTAIVNYGDGSGVQPLTLNADMSFMLMHIYNGVGPYTTTVQVTNDRGAISTKTMSITVLAPIQISETRVDDGTAQRSMVRSLAVTFSRAVTSYDAGAFALTPMAGAPVPLTVMFDGTQTTVTLTFPTLSLDDDRYTLTLDATKFHDSTFGNLDGDGNGLSGGNYNFMFHRLFGDSDGNGVVNNADFLAFRSAFGGTSFLFDFDGNGSVGTSDFLAFRSRFGSSV